MKRDFEVLDRNLALLMKLWEPVVARGEFRTRVEREFVAAVARRRMRAVPSERRSAFASPFLRVAAAAAVLLCALFAWNSFSGGPEIVVATVESILERGQVASRDARDGEWRASEGGFEAAALEMSGDFLELHTPADAFARVVAAGAEPWSVFPASHVALECGADGVVAQLHDGGLIAQAPARVRTVEGELVARTGGARVAFELPDDERLLALAPRAERWIHVSARAGSLELRGRERGVLALERAADAWLAGGVALLAPTEAGADEAERTEVGNESAEPTAQAPAYGLFGRVSFENAPIERFRVVALQQVNLPQRAEPQPIDCADPDGRFELATLLPGTYRLFVVAEGFAVAKSELLVVVPGSAQRVDFELERGSTVFGSVLDAATGVPVSGAYIVSESDTQIAVLSLDVVDNEGFDRSVVAFGNGNFRFERLASGAQILRASAPGYGPAWVDLGALEPGEERRDVVFRLGRTGRIAGSVLDAAGLPVPEVVVIASTADFERKRPCLTYRRVIGDMAGRYELPDLGVGAWAVLNFGAAAKLRDNQYAPEFGLATVRAGEVTTVNFHAKRPKKALSGIVRDASGAPLADLMLMVAPKGASDPSKDTGWNQTTTAADGSYRLADIEPGEYDLYISWTGPVELVFVETFEVITRGDAVHDMTLRGTTLSGRVLDGVHARPIESAVLVLYSFDSNGVRNFTGKVLTDAEGRYTLRPVPDGRHQVLAYSTDGTYGQEWAEITLREGVVTGTLDFTLQLGGMILVRVRAGAEPVAGASVQFFDERGVEVQFSARNATDASGTSLLVGIKPGRWRVSATDASGRTIATEVDISDGARALAELDFGGR
ncbi:MAG: carboxypeptidase regulatory-like domain-containing protein [Planctomycetes bacterium]|nr:carboxypeptidase regulatory-like domain-containing protein [Planctomycetota bacterium]